MGELLNPFSLRLSNAVRAPMLKACIRLLEPSLEKLFALSQIYDCYRRVVEDPRDMDFAEKTLELMKIELNLSADALDRIPASGPAIVVANHPFGGVEGFILASLLEKRRPDTKLLVNYLLERVPELRDRFIYVNPFESIEAARKNLRPLKETISFVSSGGLLVVFPAGAVSHFQFDKRRVTDPEWSPTIARIIKKTGAPVIPIFFEGSNGLLFQLAGMIHPLLRTALIPRELYNKRNKKITLKIGNLIPPEKMKRFECDEKLMSYLRLRTYILGSSRRETDPSGYSSILASRKLEPVIPAIDGDLLEKEVAALPEDQILDRNGDFLVAYAKAQEIPFILREIGRLREISFRLVQEGTGKSIDLDRFDNYYTHLFVWNAKAKEIVGAYRLVRTDRVLRNYGINGLYTSTLFAYRPQLLTQMGPALELGRSFVRAEYQRNFNSLHMLWRGIGLYVAKHPRYRILFGTVSISGEYDSVSQQLITLFLETNNFLPELAKLIRARNPMPRSPIRGLDVDTTSIVVKDIQGVSELIREVEANNDKGLPVLLRQYLRLGGKLLGFNIDENFGNVLDGLIYIDLAETDQRILERYLGKSGSRAFLEYHSKTPSAAGVKRTGTSA